MQHLLYLRKPSGPEVSHPAPLGHSFGERTESSGEFHRARGGGGTGQLGSEVAQQRQNPPRKKALQPQPGGGVRASLPAPLPSPDHPKFCPGPASRPQEWSFLPFPMAEPVWDLLIQVKANPVLLLLDTSVLCSGQSSGPETSESPAAPSRICPWVPWIWGHHCPETQ